MPKVRITEAVQARGKILVPGVHDLDQATVDTLAQHGRDHLVVQLDGGADDSAVDSAVDPLADFEQLREAGYTVETARAASDEELLAVKGVGRATLKQIREALA